MSPGSLCSPPAPKHLQGAWDTPRELHPSLREPWEPHVSRDPCLAMPPGSPGSSAEPPSPSPGSSGSHPDPPHSPKVPPRAPYPEAPRVPPRAPTRPKGAQGPPQSPPCPQGPTMAVPKKPWGAQVPTEPNPTPSPRSPGYPQSFRSVPPRPQAAPPRQPRPRLPPWFRSEMGPAAILPRRPLPPARRRRHATPDAVTSVAGASPAPSRRRAAGRSEVASAAERGEGAVAILGVGGPAPPPFCRDIPCPDRRRHHPGGQERCPGAGGVPGARRSPS